MPSNGSIGSCSKANGNSYSELKSLTFPGTSQEDDLLVFQDEAISSLVQIIRNTSDPNYEAPTVVNGPNVNIPTANIFLRYSMDTAGLGSKTVIMDIKLDYNTLSVGEGSPPIALPFGHVFSNPTSVDITATNSGVLTANYDNTGSAGAGADEANGTFTVNYTYNPTTTVLTLVTTTTSTNTVSATFSFSVTALAARTPPNGTFPGDLATARTDITFSTDNVVLDTVSTDTTYVENVDEYTFNTGLQDVAGEIYVYLDILNAEQSTSVPGPGLYILYDPAGTQTPAPSKDFLAGYLANDPTYAEGGTGPTNLTLYQNLANYFYLPLRNSAQYVYDNPASDDLCAEDSTSGVQFCGTDPCSNRSINVRLQ